MSSKKIISQKSVETVDRETGEVKEEKKVTVYSVPKEPAYIKLYLEDIGKLYELPNNSSSLLYELLRRMDYDGFISLNSTNKKMICKKTGYKVQSLDNYLQNLIKNKLFVREGRGVFKPDPHLFGKGEWSEIHKRREAWIKVSYSADGDRSVQGGLVDSSVVGGVGNEKV
ncbi:MAG: replication/maintenance protein RepL [Neptuniibacter sp.]